jgi:6-phosphofructokinase 1
MGRETLQRVRRNTGGKLLVGQAGGATAVINSSLVGVIEEARHSERFDAIWGMRRGLEGALQGSSSISLSRLKYTGVAGRHAGAALGSSRHRMTDDDAEHVLDLCGRNDIRAFLYIGGNDSPIILHRLAGGRRSWSGAVCDRGAQDHRQ